MLQLASVALGSLLMLVPLRNDGEGLHHLDWGLFCYHNILYRGGKI